MSEMQWNEQVILVTGASRGIGKGILTCFANAGATVIGTATSETGAERISGELQHLGAKGQGMVLDVTQSEAVEQTVATIQADYGTITVLVNNAGITRDTLLMRMKEEDWQAVIDANLTGLYRVSKACLKGMMKQRSGRIINIGSVIGAMGNAGQVNYAAAKAGLTGMTKALAREIGGRGITVNAVAPGYIETDMTDGLADEQREFLLSQIPLQRLGQVEDIAQAVFFLASSYASYITGHVLHVNGGMLMA